MGAIATFSFTQWIGRYPEFATTVGETQADDLFATAQMYHANDGTGPVTNPDFQQRMLYQLVAHLAQLTFGSSSQPLSPLVGQITNASEGSVSVAVQAQQPASGSKEWYDQTKYGAAYLAAIAPYKFGGWYRPGPRRVMNPWDTFGGRLFR